MHTIGSSPVPRYLIGIDDTDNLHSRGTGFRARTLASRLQAEGLGRCDGVTRHQLLVDPRIPYTSHNSSLCLRVEVEDRLAGALAEFACAFLLRESAPGSDAGLCLVRADLVTPAMLSYGHRAKSEVLSHGDAEAFARTEGVLLRGLTGDHGGVIGALAGVALHATGEDGRFVWLHGVREMAGVIATREIRARTRIDAIRTLEGRVPGADARIDVGPWPRPVLLGGDAVLLVEHKQEGDGDAQWRTLPKDRIRQY